MAGLGGSRPPSLSFSSSSSAAVDSLSLSKISIYPSIHMHTLLSPQTQFFFPLPVTKFQRRKRSNTYYALFLGIAKTILAVGRPCYISSSPHPPSVFDPIERLIIVFQINLWVHYQIWEEGREKWWAKFGVGS